jgi:phosphate transport system substrate-binding protein
MHRTPCAFALVLVLAAAPALAAGDTIQIVGSAFTLRPILDRWVETFRRAHPETRVRVAGDGTADGPAALISGRAQIAAMSRPMSPGEIKVFRDRYDFDPLGVPVGLDMVAVYVHAGNPVERLTLRQLDAIFSEGRRCGANAPAKRWGDVGLDGEWTERPIRIFGRRSASGTGGFFQQVALCGGLLRGSLQEKAGGGAVAAAVAESAYAIGFGNRVEDTAGVKVVAIARSEDDAQVLPDREGLHSGDYPLTRELFLYARRPPGEAIDPDIAAFLAFAVSAEGQAIVEQAGFVRVPEASVRESLVRLR